MALQLLFSNWWENETEHTLRIMSQGISDADVEYILHTVSVTDNYESLPEDEENADLANTLYLRLPSSAHAIVRTGTYTVENSMQTANIIVHAFIAEEGEEITPLLYAINNCFRTALTQEEQTQLRQTDYLPASPLPRPQFKLSQAEIRKFFSQGRLRTLASLLQAVIDSHDNQRIILLNDSYPSLKYWFYGIHTCLPKNITSSLTYCTYAFNKPDDCILICTAPNHTIDLNEDIEEGNFVIDNIGENGCHDIEAAQFASYVVHQFWDDAASIKELTDSLEDIMNTYSLNIATAAGLLKLIEFDFNWFASAYDIHYYLGKVSTIDKSVLEVVSQKLWEAFFSPDFKFDIGVDTLPLLAYIFRNTDDEVKWQIIHHIDTHKEKLGYRTFETFELLYLDLIDRLSFVTEFIPFTLIESQTLADYCKARDPHPSELTAFLYIIVDNYEKYSALLEPEILNDQTLYLFERLLGSQKTDLATEVVKRATHLPYDFLRYVVVQGILNSSNDKDTPDDTELHLSDTFVYSIARLLIEKDNSLALELVKNHARKGKYHDSTLALYIDLLADFPEETADFDDTLKAKAVYADFVTDSIFYKFASLQNASTEELTDFFRNYYLTGEDRNHYFETKLLQHLQESLPVCSIETADYFLKLLAKETPNYLKYTLSGMLCSYILHRNPLDLFDYFWNIDSEIEESYTIIKTISPSLSPVFRAVTLLIAVQTANETVSELDPDYAKIVDDAYQALISTDPDVLCMDDNLNEDFLTMLIRQILLFATSMINELHRIVTLSERVLVPLFRNTRSQTLMAKLWSDCTAQDPAALYPYTVRILLSLTESEEDTISASLHGVLNTIDLKVRRDVYRSFLSYTRTEEEKKRLIDYLSDYYYRDLTLLQKCVACDRKKLFQE